jgi:hypothetical protein
MRRKAAWTTIILGAVVLLICLPSRGASGSDPAQGSSESGAPQYGSAKEICRLKDDRARESSGIAASIVNRDAFWTHNDSGDSARIFLFNRNCEIIAVVNLKNVQAVDWEDIATFKKGDASYVLIADTGDNFRGRKSGVLYLIREPSIPVNSDEKKPVVLDVTPEAIVPFSYEDGLHDCESAAVDPVESTIFLASKDGNECKIYSVPIPSKAVKQPVIAKAIATHKISYATAMDISSDGTRAIILTYSNAYEFSRSKGETWAQAFSREPRMIKMPPRQQGESICYGADGKTLYLTSEGESQPVWELPAIENPK